MLTATILLDGVSTISSSDREAMATALSQLISQVVALQVVVTLDAGKPSSYEQLICASDISRGHFFASLTGLYPHYRHSLPTVTTLSRRSASTTVAYHAIVDQVLPSMSSNIHMFL